MFAISQIKMVYGARSKTENLIVVRRVLVSDFFKLSYASVTFLLLLGTIISYLQSFDLSVIWPFAFAIILFSLFYSTHFFIFEFIIILPLIVTTLIGDYIYRKLNRDKVV